MLPVGTALKPSSTWTIVAPLRPVIMAFVVTGRATAARIISAWRFVVIAPFIGPVAEAATSGTPFFDHFGFLFPVTLDLHLPASTVSDNFRFLRAGRRFEFVRRATILAPERLVTAAPRMRIAVMLCDAALNWHPFAAD